jgi:hypothetical protein
MDSRSLISLRFAITHLEELIVAFRGFILGLDLGSSYKRLLEKYSFVKKLETFPNLLIKNVRPSRSRFFGK